MKTNHRIYLASSWRNPRQPEVLAALRADGHEVYDFRNPAPGDNGFSWREIGDRFGKCADCGEQDPLNKPRSCSEGEVLRDGTQIRRAPHRWEGGWDAAHFATHVLDHPIAAYGFGLDMAALEACSACVLLLECGKSAHLELGQAVGARKLTIVYMPVLVEPELMYRMCDYVETTLEGVRKQLSQDRDPPRWQTDLRRTSADEFRGLCAPHRHRSCAVCQGCWRHGSCTCGPVTIVDGKAVHTR